MTWYILNKGNDNSGKQFNLSLKRTKNSTLALNITLSLWAKYIRNNVPASVNIYNCEAFSNVSFSHFFPLCFTSQAQFSHIGASLHTRTPFSYRVPADSQAVFLLVNVLYAVMPQALCYRCCTRPAFFLRPTLNKKAEWRGRESVPGMSRMPK